MKKKMITGNRARKCDVWQGLLLISVVLLSGCGGGGGGGGSSSSSSTTSFAGNYTGQVRATDANLNDGAEYFFTVASDGTISGKAETSSNYPLTGKLTPGGSLTLNIPQFYNITGQVHLVNGNLLNGSGKEFNVSDGSLHDTVTFDLQQYSSP